MKASTPQDRATLVILGAICGDIIGSAYEFHSTKDYDFDLFTRRSGFTDDSVCTIALADALAGGEEYKTALHRWCREYIYAGYGGRFYRWVKSDDPQPYGSFGNGSAMRVSPAGAWARTLDEAMSLAKWSAIVSHNHPEGIKGAQATATAIYYALRGISKEALAETISLGFHYDLSRTYDEIKPGYGFNETCQGTVPEAITCFLTGTDYESTIRLAVALGGDADTLGAIAGGIAAAYYGEIPDHILNPCLEKLDPEMKDVLTAFNEKFKTRQS